MSNLKNSDDHEQRISIKRKRPNPLFQEWLEELHEEAQAKNSKLTPMLKKALESLTKYPLPLKTGAECAILNGFEKKLCIFLDKRLEVYYSNKNLESVKSSSSENETVNSEDSNLNGANHSDERKHEPSTSADVVSNKAEAHNSNKDSSCKSNTANPSIEHEPINTNSPTYTNGPTNSNGPINTQPISNTSEKNKKIGKHRQEYKPAFRSGGYAILIALLEDIQKNSETPGLKKEALIENAQKHCEESFVRPKPQTYYTAWSNMARLVTKGFVQKVRNKYVMYSLTDKGILLASNLLKESKNILTTNDIIFNDVETPLNSSQRDSSTDNIEGDLSSTQGTSQSSNAEQCVITMSAGSFEVILLIDKNETVSKKTDPTVAQFNAYADLKHEYRSLKVGDFTWIARSKADKTQELVLPYVVERKRMDDLGASIKDGRFHEQKFRLRKCGLNNVIYLVENYGRNTHVGLPMTSLMQALANTRVQDGFEIHVTDSLSHSCRFLAMMTKRLTLEFQNHDLKGCNSEATTGKLMTFTYFNKSSAKTKPLTVTETFIKLLLQLKGVSVEKALSITNVYKTPSELIRAYQNCTSEDPEKLLASLKYGNANRCIGPSVSKSIYYLFTKK